MATAFARTGPVPNWRPAGALAVLCHVVLIAVLAVPPGDQPVAIPEPVMIVELPEGMAAPESVQEQQPEIVEQEFRQPLPDVVSPRLDIPEVRAPISPDPVVAPPPRPMEPVNRALPQRPVEPPRAVSAPPAAGAGNAGDGPADDPQAQQREADYRTLVRSYIARNRFNPPRSRRERLSGDIGVRFVINRNGDLSGVEVSRSSGHQTLDEEAVEFIRNLNRVPAFPRDLRRSEIPLSITLRFSLQRD